jgi:hypothetical protein
MSKRKGLACCLPAEECKQCSALKAEIDTHRKVNRLLIEENNRLRARRCAVYKTASHDGMPEYLGIVHMFRDIGGKTRIVVETTEGRMVQPAPECVRMLDKPKA